MDLCLVAGEPDLPGEIERIHGNATAADARAGEKGHEAEGFRGGGFDDFPRVDSDLATSEGELVGEGDVDAAEGVFEKLGRLGDPRARGLKHASW